MSAFRDPARLLRAMAHPVRLEILYVICRSDECVCHLSAALKKSQPYVSQQLAILRNAGLIVDRKEGNLVFYGLADGQASVQVNEILSAISGQSDVGRIANSPGDVGRIANSPASSEAAGHVRVAGCTCPKCERAGDRTQSA